MKEKNKQIEKLKKENSEYFDLLAKSYQNFDNDIPWVSEAIENWIEEQYLNDIIVQLLSCYLSHCKFLVKDKYEVRESTTQIIDAMKFLKRKVLKNFIKR